MYTFVALSIESQVSVMLGKHSMAELYPQPNSVLLRSG